MKSSYVHVLNALGLVEKSSQSRVCGCSAGAWLHFPAHDHQNKAPGSGFGALFLKLVRGSTRLPAVP